MRSPRTDGPWRLVEHANGAKPAPSGAVPSAQAVRVATRLAAVQSNPSSSRLQCYDFRPVDEKRDALDRYDELPSVQFARGLLRDAFGLELSLTDAGGPAAHRRGAIMASSSPACRTALFSREGFARCDAFYRDGGEEPGAFRRPCHLGLMAVGAEADRPDAGPIRAIVSGFLPHPGSEQQFGDIARQLAGLAPESPGPMAIARKTVTLTEDQLGLVEIIVAAVARELGDHGTHQPRQSPSGTTDGPGLWGLLGASASMRQLFASMQRMAPSHAPVLVVGESGTGKTVVARALHDHGPRHGGPFVAQGCGALPDGLLDSTVFGHVRGAFSGAVRDSIGLLGAAGGGTLFLDEVDEMSPALQVKLLRVLQEGRYRPVGATEDVAADVRIIAAAHSDLKEMVDAGRFRQDLFYRLHVLPLNVPPLRERRGDIPWLVRRFCAELGMPQRPIAAAAWDCLERHPWPGNVRELRAEVQRWQVSASSAEVIGMEHLTVALRAASGLVGDDDGAAARAAVGGDATLAEAVAALERVVIRAGLERTRGNRRRLARELGISRTTLLERIHRYGLDDGGADNPPFGREPGAPP